MSLTFTDSWPSPASTVHCKMKSLGVVARALEDQLDSAKACNGGCDNDAFILTLRQRGRVFVKINSDKGVEEKFNAESISLQEIVSG